MDESEHVDPEKQSEAQDYVNHGNQTTSFIPMTTSNSDNGQTLQSTFKSKKPLRKGRGSKKLNLAVFDNISRANIHPVAEILNVADSKSSIRNATRAKSVLTVYMARVGGKDPVFVSPESSDLIVNLLSTYCRTSTENPLSSDSMGALVQGLRQIYDENGHRGRWTVDTIRGIAVGNPLKENEDIQKLRAAHRVKLARIDRAKTRPRPLQVGHVIEHAAKFWLGSGNVRTYQDVLLHAILVVGLNLGLRYDEIQKFKIGSVTVVPGTVGEGSIYFSLTVAIKNSTSSRTYVIKEWPGDTELRMSIMMDPFIALMTWMCIRGNRPGYLFCDVNDKSMISAQKPWSVSCFQKFFRGRLRLCGVGSDDTLWYTGHSIKRGSVQLYRSLGVRDEQICEWIQMTGAHAYTNYCAAYNDCQAIDLPRFASREPFLNHASIMIAEARKV